MVTMDMTASQMITPVIIFQGKMGSNLQKEWDKRQKEKNGKNKSIVLFNENHWQTSYTVMIYLDYLRKKLYYNKEKIGIVWDRASMHNSKDVLDYIDKCIHDNNLYPRFLLSVSMKD